MQDGTVIIQTKVPSMERAILRQYKSVEIGFCDGRNISPIQRRKIYSLIGEIAEYIEGYKNAGTIESTKQMLKMDFIINHLQGMERKMFSLSDVPMSTASSFITYLIDFIIRNDIPSSVSLLEHCDDVAAYIYACLIHRKCCLCGLPAQLHHCTGSRIGIGNDRTEVHHLGRECLPLCEKHHSEAHQDEKGFIEKHHLEVIKIDERVCKIYKLRK